nr:hypothetical protein [Tanacetum cinerariifolium]
MAGLLSNHEEGKQVGRGRRSRGPRGGNDDHVDELNGQENDQGVGANGGVEGVNGNVGGVNGGENVRKVLVNGNRVGCSYKECLACNPKEYDGKGGVVVLTRWIEKMESVQVMSGCSIDQKVKYTAGSFVGKALTWWNSQIRILSRELETELWNHAIVSAGHAAYTDRFHELAGNGSIKMVEKRGNMDEPSMDKNDRDDNKRTRIGNSFATTGNPDGFSFKMTVWSRDSACISQKEGKSKGQLLCNAEDKAECKKLKKELEEAKFSNTLLYDVPIVEPNQHGDVPVVPDLVLVDEDEDPKEEEFEKEEEPQEEEDDMEVDIKEDENEQELTYPYKEEDDNEPKMTYPYEEVRPLNPLPPAFESEPEDVIKVKDTVESEDKTIPASVHEIASLSRRLCGRETTHSLVKKKGKEKDEYHGKLILDLGNKVRSSMEEETAGMKIWLKSLAMLKKKKMSVKS